MYKLIIFLPLLINTTVYSQFKNDCFIGCSRTTSMRGAENARFFQDNKMDFYDIKHLKLDIEVQPRSVAIKANCSYLVEVKQLLDTFVIEFKQNMTLDSVFLNSTKVAFSQRNDHVYVPVNTASSAGSLLNVTFYYKGNVGAGFFSGTDLNGLDYTASLSESYQAREWFPAKQLLNDKIDSTDIWITTGSAYKAGSNGLLKAVINVADNLKQYRWSCRYPLNYYMPSISVGNYLEYNIFAKPAAITPDSILIQNYLYNNSTYLSQVKPLIDKTAPFLEKMSELFGIYPFYKEKYGHSQAAIGGGMEHATMTTLQNFEENLVAHELGHQWFGDNVTCASWNDIWLNESFATYIQYLMHEKLSNLFTQSAAQHMNDFHESAMSGPGGSVWVPLFDTYNESRIFNYRLSYAKGATAVHNLRFEMQSDTLFFNTLKLYQQRFKNSFATTEDFKKLAEEVSGKNLTSFFNQRIFGAGYPIYSVTYSKHGRDTLVLDISQATSEPGITPLFTGLMEYKILSPQGDTVIQLNQTANNQRFTLLYRKTPNGVVVDPNNWVLNRVLTIKEGEFTTPPPDKLSIYPNPVQNNFTISVPPNDYSSVELIDVKGRRLATYTIPAGSTMLTQNLFIPAGIYFLRFTGNNKATVQKILVNAR